MPIPSSHVPSLLLPHQLPAGGVASTASPAAFSKPGVLLDRSYQRAGRRYFTVRIHLDLTQESVKLSESFNRMAQELEKYRAFCTDFINNFPIGALRRPSYSLRGFAKILKRQFPNPGGAGRISLISLSASSTAFGPTGYQRAEFVQGGEDQHFTEYQRLN